MRIRVDAASSVPPFEQVREQILALVHGGGLAAGAKLPTVRGLAEELSLAPGTVAKAYRLLEQDGIIETRGRAGSVVAAQGDVAEQRMQQLARDYADEAARLHVDAGRALDWVRAALRD